MDNFTLTNYPFINSESLASLCAKLKRANFPFHGAFDDPAFSEELRTEAKQVHFYLSNLLCASEQPGWSYIKFKEALETVISGELNFGDYIEKMRQFDSYNKCNAVWPIDSIAYRCNTCAFNPCMSLCSDCFLTGGHEGHDYNRFFSLSGGACDCGNDDVLDSKGFCTRHGPNRGNIEPPPIELTALPEILYVKLFIRLLNNFRRWHKRLEAHSIARRVRRTLEYGNSPNLLVSEQIFKDAENIISIIQHLVNEGGPTIGMISSILLDEDLYSKLNSNQYKGEKDAFPIEDLCDSRNEFLADASTLSSFSSFFLTRSYLDQHFLRLHKQNNIEPDDDELCKCILDELVFYLIRLFFPQRLINLLLCFLPDNKYKKHFSCKYFGYYSRIAALMLELMDNVPAQSNETSELSSRIIHISVQVCSSVNICKMLNEEVLVIDKIFNTGFKILFCCAKQLELGNSSSALFNRMPVENTDEHRCFVADVENNKFISRFGYSYFSTDLQNLFAHVHLSTSLAKELRLCEMYASFISSMQYINVIWRIVSGNHIEVEKPALSGRAFTLEWEASTSVMFNTLACLEEAPQLDALVNFLQAFSNALKTFFNSLKLQNGYDAHNLQCQPYAISYHLPLHRHFSYTLWLAMTSDSKNADGIYEYENFIEEFALNEEDFLLLCTLHLIRIQVVRAEFQASMWVRNGTMIRNAVQFYDRVVFALGIQNLDIFLLRFCAANINQELFFNVLYMSFHLDDCQKYLNCQENSPQCCIITSSAWVPSMYDGYLRLLLNIIALNTYAGMSLDDCLRAELVRILLFGSLPHSKLISAVPERGMKSQKDHKNFDSILNEIAEYVEPDQGDNIRQGQYKLKDSIWLSEFDPVFTRMRSLSIKDYNAILLKVEERELAHIATLKNSKNESEKSLQHVWIGYQLIDFDKVSCFPSVEGTWALLTQPSFFYTMHAILKKCLTFDSELDFILQQAIYLLTLSAQFVSSKHFNHDRIQKRFYTRESIPRRQSCQPSGLNQEEGILQCTLLDTPLHDIDVRMSKNHRAAVFNYFGKSINGSSLLELIIDHFKHGYNDAPQAEIYSRLMHNYVAKSTSELTRIYGSAKDYIGRLISLLYKNDAHIRRVFDDYFEEHVLKNAEDQLESINLMKSGNDSIPNTSEDSQISAKKLLTKRKRNQFLIAQREKHARLMQKMMSREGISQGEMDELRVEKNKHAAAKVYECPICNESTTCTIDNLMGLLVHVQSNQILESRFSAQEPPPCIFQQNNEKDKRLFESNYTRDILLNELYNDAARFSRFSCSVHVTTCGHTAHLTCFNAYVATLDSSQHLSSVPSEQVYSCPMCRQPLNAILPIKPELDYEKKRLKFSEVSLRGKFLECGKFLLGSIDNWRFASVDINKLYAYTDGFNAFETFCKHLSNPSDLRYSSTQQHRNVSQALLLGMVRADVEYQLFLKEKTIVGVQNNKKQRFLKHLTYKTRINHDVFPDIYVRREVLTFFPELAGVDIADTIENYKHVPAMAYDEYSALCLFCSYILADETLIDEDKLELCKLIYMRIVCLLFSNIVLSVFLLLTDEEAEELATGSHFISNAQKFNAYPAGYPHELAKACDIICKIVKPKLTSSYFNNDRTKYMDIIKEYGEFLSSDKSSINVHSPSLLIMILCDRFGAKFSRFFLNLMDEHDLMRGFTYTPLHLASPSPSFNVASSSRQAESLEEKRELNTSEDSMNVHMELAQFYHMILTYSSTTEDAFPVKRNDIYEEIGLLKSFKCSEDVIANWTSEYADLINECFYKNKFYLQAELRTNLLWRDPSLLSLPNKYDEIFSHFFGSLCEYCEGVPECPMLCLVCGTMCCLGSCCNTTNTTTGYSDESELERHTNACCYGAGCFLALTSSVIVLVRNGLALVWGSVYLDSYGEEDRNLKRGKPLFLSSHRFNRLQDDWLRQNLVRKSSHNGWRTWLTMDQTAQVLKDAHFFA